MADTSGAQYFGKNSSCGYSDGTLLAETNRLNTAFSENAWSQAQLEGCSVCPQKLPSWPPSAFVYPELEQAQQLVGGVDPNFAITDTPYYQSPVIESRPAMIGIKAGGQDAPGHVDTPFEMMQNQTNGVRLPEVSTVGRGSGPAPAGDIYRGSAGVFGHPDGPMLDEKKNWQYVRSLNRAAAHW
eukprot:gnl/Hemi2/28051_TR9266_c0_g1_i1.p1 gnl/Hemi2/28051_TR9266_c0_g1~~gnl/Hemi2/28051_TR9266_c0_g1_i1.p1  ORF type:complete len:197 (-),score=45.41 gnl/Hemi2/28051_TR9266_c0_g1_i1:219-770(-)